MQSLEFLTKVWAPQPDGFVCVSAKGVKWRDYSFRRDDIAGLKKWLANTEGQDRYFCPLTFRQGRRKKDLAQDTVWLWGDIDEGDTERLPPTVLWESSPGRFAGLWRVRQMSPERAAGLSRRIAYHIDGDRGGWDITQVLRIPGTRNHKYDPAPRVRLIEWSNRTWSPSEIPKDYRDRIPANILKILEGPASGDRSEMLWRLEAELLKAGIPREEVIRLLRASDWNKYRGRHDEIERFETELSKHDTTPLGVTTYRDLMQSPGSPGWLVEGFWQRESHGIVAGQPKTFKTTFCMDLAFSVATGSRFLNKFEVGQQGPVLFIQNENTDWIMRERFQMIAHQRPEPWGSKVSLRGDRISARFGNYPDNIYFINQQGVTIDRDAARIEEAIQQVKPVLIILDPLYLMFTGDINSAQELQPMLAWALDIKHRYRAAVILVHHYGKGQGSGGQRMLGSTTLHGWIESAWYLKKEGDRVTLEKEFRGADSGEPSVFTIGPGFVVTHNDGIREVLASATELNIAGLVSRTGLSKEYITQQLQKYEREGYVEQTDDGWRSIEVPKTSGGPAGMEEPRKHGG